MKLSTTFGNILDQFFGAEVPGTGFIAFQLPNPNTIVPWDIAVRPTPLGVPVLMMNVEVELILSPRYERPIQSRFALNPISLSSNISGLESGIYPFQIKGITYLLYLDNLTDGRGWVLIHKTDRSSSSDKTDTGHNETGLQSPDLNTVSILERAFIAQMGLTFRVTSRALENYKLFWKGKSYYTTESHPPKPSDAWIKANIKSKYSWDDKWQSPCEEHSKTGTYWEGTTGHGFTMWGPSGAHFCATRWCGGPDPGIHFNNDPPDPKHQ